MSGLTTNFGPRVSFTTSAAQSSVPVHVHIPSHATLTVAGREIISGTQIMSNLTTASLTSVDLADGEFRFGAHSGNGVKIWFRSGVTVYQSTLTGAVI
jgi:hypothetical protein